MGGGEPVVHGHEHGAMVRHGYASQHIHAHTASFSRRGFAVQCRQQNTLSSFNECSCLESLFFNIQRTWPPSYHVHGTDLDFFCLISGNQTEHPDALLRCRWRVQRWKHKGTNTSWMEKPFNCTSSYSHTQKHTSTKRMVRQRGECDSHNVPVFHTNMGRGHTICLLGRIQPCRRNNSTLPENRAIIECSRKCCTAFVKIRVHWLARGRAALTLSTFVGRQLASRHSANETGRKSNRCEMQL